MIEYTLIKIPEDKKIIIKLENATYAELILNVRLDKCKILSQTYKFIYNPDITFDEITEGNLEDYKYSVTLGFDSEDYLEFYAYDIQAKLDMINQLEGCLQLEHEGSND